MSQVMDLLNQCIPKYGGEDDRLWSLTTHLRKVQQALNSTNNLSEISKLNSELSETLDKICPIAEVGVVQESIGGNESIDVDIPKGVSQNADMKELTEEKIRIAHYYSKNICNEKIQLPKPVEGTDNVWHQYVLRCEERDAFIDYLNKKEIGTIIHYPIPPYRAKAYAYLGHKEGYLPFTEHLAKTVVSIPMYNGMTKEEQEKRFACKKEELEEKKEENRQIVNEFYEKGIAETKNMAEKLKNI